MHTMNIYKMLVCMNVEFRGLKLQTYFSQDVLLIVNNGIRTHIHFFKGLSSVVSTDLYGAFDCMLLSCRVRVSE